MAWSYPILVPRASGKEAAATDGVARHDELCGAELRSEAACGFEEAIDVFALAGHQTLQEKLRLQRCRTRRGERGNKDDIANPRPLNEIFVDGRSPIKEVQPHAMISHALVVLGQMAL